MSSPFIILGWKEWVSLPHLNLPAIKAKIDTGAATSSIHAYHIEYFNKDNKTFVKYLLHPIQRNKKITIPCISEVIDEREVKSSSGQKEVRPVIKTLLKIGKSSWEIELNLTNRDLMYMRMLLGREALSSRVLVDPNHKFLHGNFTMRKINKLYTYENSDIIQK